MKNKWIAVACAIAAILQTVGLLRHVQRLPDDYVGIAIYAATILAFCIAGAGFYMGFIGES